MRSVRSILSLIFGIIGLSFAVTAVIIFSVISGNSAGMVPVEARILSTSGSGGPSLAYEYNGETYYAVGHVSSTAQRKGGVYTLLCDPQDPARHADPNIRILVYIFGGIGGCFLVVSAVLLSSASAEKRRKERVLSTGIRRSGVIIRVETVYSIRKGSRHPRRVYIDMPHPLTGKPVTICSDLIWDTELREGDTADVVFDQLDERLYAVDIPQKGR